MTSNYVDSTGLHTQTLNDIVTELETSFKSIYGSDININSNSPDGQMINILAQSKIDTLDCIASVYNSFSPQLAAGRVLDQRAAINGIFRKSATYTTIEIDITTDRVVSLVGQTSGAGTPFTVSDAQGNQFFLMDNQTTIAGVNRYEFISAIAGKIETTVATITKIVTITLGVLSVNNPNDPLINGTDEESDFDFRIRRSRSVAIPSQGYLEGLTSAIFDLDGVVGAVVYENNGAVTDIYGTPPHTIWPVVDGGVDAEIADVIYKKRNAGCGLRGDTSVVVPMINGFNFLVKFQRAIYEDLYIQLTVTSLDPSHLISEAAIEQAIYDNITYGINQPSDYTNITTVVKTFDKYAVILSGGVSSDGLTFVPYLFPSSIASRFIISTSRINITVV